MAKIRFTKKAKIDLEEIWEYTYETWSENKLINITMKLLKNARH